ncbi:hypothetical protein Palpr_0407 [Paludibacter propionicigenes WB4]|uniref:Polysaccharide pyruvyl transferase domain-containing protein n=1 Tax=Paludibacter propionicigenes (strain DSM 17365 / JCM 13257 / WB4) TaxID=694427 RepID=E4T1H3_PALPW|nr:polysaccharide pyruvyl transferase family protein [Paludibacter propionicigenes]ADQ78567.1 hypothetical protein Palpr_0407 [Paludibacter propionicigenes WB4]
MRILVITFSRGVNPGTFIQAFGVQTGLRKIFPDSEIVFLNFPDFKRGNQMARSGKISIKTYIFQKGAAAYRMLRYKMLEQKYFIYTKQKVDMFNYDVTSINFIKSYDLVVIGSDTILEEVTGSKGQIGLNWMPLNVPKVYFAASASPANFEVNQDLMEVASMALHIGVRDDLTIDLFVNRLGLSKDMVLKQPDPSYFLDLSLFDLKPKHRNLFKREERYVLYNFNSGFPYRKELADILRKLGYNVVSTAYNPYADICLDKLDAMEWAGVFRYIDLSVTERFHDSVFTLRNCKPVIAIDWEKKRFSKNGNSKTLGILSDYGLEKYHVNLKEYEHLDIVRKLILDSILIDRDSIQIMNNKYIDYARNLLYVIKSKI